MNKSLALLALIISAPSLAAVNTTFVDAIVKSDLERVEFLLNGTTFVTKENKAAYLDLADEILEQRKEEVKEWLKPYASFKLALRAGLFGWYLHCFAHGCKKVEQLMQLETLSSSAGTPEHNAKMAALFVGSSVGITFSAFITLFCLYLTYNTVKDGRVVNENNMKAFISAAKIKHLIQSN